MKRQPIPFERHVEIGRYFKILRQQLFKLEDEFSQAQGTTSKVVNGLQKLSKTLCTVRSDAEDVLARTYRNQWTTHVYYGPLDAEDSKGEKPR
jgi:hypothetical protein